MVDGASAEGQTPDSHEPDDKKITRRQILARAGLGLAGVAVAGGISHEIGEGIVRKIDELEAERTAERVAERRAEVFNSLVAPKELSEFSPGTVLIGKGTRLQTFPVVVEPLEGNSLSNKYLEYKDDNEMVTLKGDLIIGNPLFVDAGLSSKWLLVADPDHGPMYAELSLWGNGRGGSFSILDGEEFRPVPDSGDNRGFGRHQALILGADESPDLLNPLASGYAIDDDYQVFFHLDGKDFPPGVRELEHADQIRYLADHPDLLQKLAPETQEANFGSIVACAPPGSYA